MLECIISENILGQVSIQLEMTSHDWSKLKTSGVWSQMEQILMESETQSSRSSTISRQTNRKRHIVQAAGRNGFSTDFPV